MVFPMDISRILLFCRNTGKPESVLRSFQPSSKNVLNREFSGSDLSLNQILKNFTSPLDFSPWKGILRYYTRGIDDAFAG